VKDELLQTWLSTLEIDTYDLEHLFEMLDNGDGQIDVGEFINGMSRVKGWAKSIDVVKLLTVSKKIDAKLDIIVKALPEKHGMSQ